MGVCTKRKCFVFIKTFCVLLNLFCVVTVIAIVSSDSGRRTIRLIQEGYDCSDHESRQFVQDTVSLHLAMYVRTYVVSLCLCVCLRAWVNKCEHRHMVRGSLSSFCQARPYLHFPFASCSIASLTSDSDCCTYSYPCLVAALNSVIPSLGHL